MNRLLLIIDTFDVKEDVIDYFMTNGKDDFELDICNDTIEGFYKIRTEKYDLVILDVMFSSQPGLDICRIYKDHCHCPLLFVSNLEDIGEFEFAYSLGVDSLIIRPFEVSELFEKAVERINAYKKRTCAETLECGGIRMNPLTGLVTSDGKIIDLTAKTTELLKVFLENKNEVISRETIIYRVWGEDYNGKDRVVDNLVKTLRQRLGSKGDLIRTVKGKGYMIGDR